MRRAAVCTVSLTLAALAAGCGAAGAPPARSSLQALASGPIVIRNQRHRVYKGLQVSTLSGDCVLVVDSFDITIERSQIGPCGGNGVNVSGGGKIHIYDSYIHPETLAKGCCDSNDGIVVQGTRELTVQGNVIAYGESNVEAPQNVSDLTVIGNFLLNPRGPYPRGQNVQAWNSNSVVVRNNYTLSSRNTKRYLYPDDQEDSINFGVGTGFIAKDNYVTGGHSASGCGLIADDGANGVRFIGNRVVNSGQCGIGIASGTGQLVLRNRVFNRTQVPGGGNTAIYVWNQYASVPCGPVNVSGNVATEIRSDHTQSGFWNGGGCDPVTLRGNTWDQAAKKKLTPLKEKLPPPSIPPQPAHCVIQSPYSTQTKWPPCGLK
jgi:hypothetical protein